MSLVLLGILGVAFRTRHVGAEQTIAYHERARELSESIPFSVGDWVGKDQAVPPSAIELLHPNVLLSRRFENMRTGEVASLLFVQCSDARDLRGHYPPACYPGQGWIDGPALARTWTVGGIEIPGVRYVFTKSSATSSSEIVVDNFMVLPTGEFGRDMSDVDLVVKNRRLRQFGAAQVQVLTSSAMEDDRRDEVLRILVEPLLPILTALNANDTEEASD